MRPDKTPFGLILLLWAAGLGAAGQYAKVSVLFDRLGEIYPHAGAALGLIVSVVGFVGIVFGVVAGALVGRIGFRRALLWALWSGAGFSLVQSLFPPLPVMLILRMLEGLSHLAIVVAVPTLIAQLSEDRHKGLTLTLWSTFFGVAFTLLVWFGLPLVETFGMHVLFWAHGAWMALCAVALTPLLSRLPRFARPARSLSLSTVWRDHTRLYGSPWLSAPGLGWLFYTFCFLALLTLLPPFIAESQRSFVLGTMPLVTIAVSMTLGVALLRVLRATQVVMIGFILLALCLIWLWGVPGGAVACFALAAAFGLVQGASFAAVPELAATAEDQALANGAMAQLGNVGNTLGTPVLAVLVLGGGYDAMIWASCAVTMSGLGVHFWLARRRSLSEPVS